MRVIADLHIHSPYSRAVSPAISVPSLDLWAKKKGIAVIGTGDFTHPKWLKHLQENLEPAEPGLYKLKNSNSLTRFLATAEISSIYSDGGKVRRVHNLIFAPSFGAVEKINKTLAERGAKLTSDGRPIVGISSRELLNIALTADPNCLFVPAHAWTPWFAVFGSKSGYNSLEECFGQDAKHIYAIETGLSSDAEMNWRLSALDNLTLISNSDPHSLRRLGREANVFDIDNLSYGEIARIIREKDRRRFLFTVEYYPEEGRYHYDGEREHQIALSPKESKKLGRRCPVCGKMLTVGVLSRVEELADRPEGFKRPGGVPGKHLVPLDEIIADSLGMGVASKKVVDAYDRMVSQRSELDILLDATEEEISALSGPLIAEGVRRVRSGQLEISPGYDGVYGRVKIFSEKEKSTKLEQKSLF